MPLTFVSIIIEFLFSFSFYEKHFMLHVLHTYRCLMVASLMFTFLIASLVTAFWGFN